MPKTISEMIGLCTGDFVTCHNIHSRSPMCKASNVGHGQGRMRKICTVFGNLCRGANLNLNFGYSYSTVRYTNEFNPLADTFGRNTHSAKCKSSLKYSHQLPSLTIKQFSTPLYSGQLVPLLHNPISNPPCPPCNRCTF